MPTVALWGRAGAVPASCPARALRARARGCRRGARSTGKVSGAGWPGVLLVPRRLLVPLPERRRWENALTERPASVGRAEVSGKKSPFLSARLCCSLVSEVLKVFCSVQVDFPGLDLCVCDRSYQ